MTPKPSLEQVWQRWREANPARSIPSVPVGYRKCLNFDCPVLIEESQERLCCYGCGGKPNKVPSPRMGRDDWKAYAEGMRQGPPRSR